MARQSRAPATPDRPGVLPPVLLTRPAAQGDRFAGLLRDRFGRNLRIVAAPLIAPEFLVPDLPADAAAVIFTSETGVAGLSRLRPGSGLPAYCVGDSTAAAASAAGFGARSAGGDAAALIAALRAESPPGLLLHARGRDSSGDIAATLSRHGLRVAEAVVYAQVERPLTAAALGLLAGPEPVAVPLFSPRTARLLVAQLPAPAGRAPIWIASLSPAVAVAAAAAAPERHEIAVHPDAAAMIDALARLMRRTAQP